MASSGEAVWQVEESRAAWLAPLHRRLLASIQWDEPEALRKADLELATFPQSRAAQRVLAREEIRAEASRRLQEGRPAGAPLRRPFQGRGAELSLGVREESSLTLSERHTRFVVNESAIMRWLGRLGASAFGDFSGRTELEENLFLYETFEALRKDVTRE